MSAHEKLIDFEGSGLLSRLGNLAEDIVKATMRQNENGEYVLKRNFRSDEEYASKSMHATSELISVCEQMGYCVDFLAGFRSKNYPKHSNITRFDYIVYHLENHLIRTGMILERSLQLANIIFQLGLPERQCSMATVTENHHIAPTEVGKSLKRIRKTTEPFRSKRNIVIHRHGYTDEELGKLEVFSIIERSDSETAKRLFHIYKSMTDNAVASKKEELYKFNQKVFKEVFSLLDSLEEVFVVKYANSIYSGDVNDLPKQ